MRKTILRSCYECCCCCCRVCVLCALRHSCKGCQSTPPGRVCGVRVARSHAPEPRAGRAQSSTITFVADRSRLLEKNTPHRAPTPACCSRPQSTRRRHRCCICTLPSLRRMTLSAFAAAWRWHGLAASAMPLVRYE